MDKQRQLSTGVQVTQEYQVYIRIHAYFSCAKIKTHTQIL